MSGASPQEESAAAPEPYPQFIFETDVSHITEATLDTEFHTPAQISKEMRCNFRWEDERTRYTSTKEVSNWLVQNLQTAGTKLHDMDTRSLFRRSWLDIFIHATEIEILEDEDNRLFPCFAKVITFYSWAVENWLDWKVMFRRFDNFSNADQLRDLLRTPGAEFDHNEKLFLEVLLESLDLFNNDDKKVGVFMRDLKSRKMSTNFIATLIRLSEGFTRPDIDESMDAMFLYFYYHRLIYLHKLERLSEGTAVNSDLIPERVQSLPDSWLNDPVIDMSGKRLLTICNRYLEQFGEIRDKIMNTGILVCEYKEFLSQRMTNLNILHRLTRSVYLET